MNLTSACHVFMDYCSWSKRTFSNLTYSEFQGQSNFVLRWKFLWISVKLWANIWNIWQRRSLEKTSRWKKGRILGIGRNTNNDIYFRKSWYYADQKMSNTHRIIVHNHSRVNFFLKGSSPNVPPRANSLASAPSKQISTFCQIWARSLQMFYCSI